MLIDATYFIGELAVANRDQQAVSARLDIFIAKYETKFLKQLMGETMYNDYVTGIAINPIPQKWIDLQNQIRNASTKESPIASYVYYWYMRDMASQSVGLGEVRPSAENSTPVSPATKMTRAWNEMVEQVHGLAKYIHGHTDEYPDYHYWLYWGWWGYDRFWRPWLWNQRPEIYFPINSLNI